MGCAQSFMGQQNAPTDASSRASTASSVDTSRKSDAWARMEEAEELEHLAEAATDAALADKLQLNQQPASATSPRAPPHGTDAHDDWDGIAAAVPHDEGYLIYPPYTLAKARALYTHLRHSHARLVSRRCLYEMLIAACRLLDEERKADGGCVHKLPTPKAGKRLLVCGDTHGQLQDVLHIFDQHGLPAPDNSYLFNGDIADRGTYAVEIFALLLAFKLAAPTTLHINRGNHEQRDLNERPLFNGGGFAWEVRGKYPHDERLIDLFQHLFLQLPLATCVGDWALVIHGGLFRAEEVTLAELNAVESRRQPPSVVATREDSILFDALWADPFAGSGVFQSGLRGGLSIQFGHDVTSRFCALNGIHSVIRSHQLPKKRRGYEIQHDSMLLTIFSASNYGGVCGNRGGVLLIDAEGPAEVKEHYALPLDALRAEADEDLVKAMQTHLRAWLTTSRLGPEGRAARQQERRSIYPRALSRPPHLYTPRWRDGAKSSVLRSIGVAVDSSPTPSGGVATERRPWWSLSRWWTRAPTPSLGAPAAADAIGEYDDECKPFEVRRSIECRELRRALSTDEAKEAMARASCASTRSEGSLAVEPSDTNQSEDDPLRRASSARKAASSLHRLGLRCSESAAAPQDPAMVSTARLQAGSRRVTQVYCTERNVDGRKVEEVLRSMRTQIGRYKAILTSAFVAAELRYRGVAEVLVSTATPRGTSAGARHVLPYAEWLAVLSAQIPEYGTLWKQYAPSLLAAATESTRAGMSARRDSVAYMLWLDRFQVRLVSDDVHALYERAVLRSLYERMLRQLETAAPRHRLDIEYGAAGLLPIQVSHALAILNLELTAAQQRQLQFALGLMQPKNGLLSTSELVRRLQRLATAGLAAVNAQAAGVNAATAAASRFSVGVMQLILSTLYSRAHIMHKAFRHFDTEGTGWLPANLFEDALRLVLQLEEHREDPLVHSDDLAALKSTLLSSPLSNSQQQIDYCAVIQSFVVVDTLNATKQAAKEPSRVVGFASEAA